ncbi:PepSY-associated TM helix domain-containing protein [Microbulbifer celer]|uniref:PepSY-associated TM helix domain-containing protein n=1 Tax=Microbulbifer celer TaxID=435905 RepID=A0ABW3UCA6_9GAMM|nr:PepSY-associated TM helix domain-containing protein [Microbulbifer celer]UFN56353.1 PepSY domain-containing protein [Microbulbifer celer]
MPTIKSDTDTHTSSTKVANAGIRQTMAWVHTWAGLTLGWVLYFMFVTGTAGYFDTEIDRWMQPELPPAQINSDTRATAATLLARAQSQAPNADQWLLTLPVDRNQPYGSIFWRGADLEAGASAERGNELIDLESGAPMQSRATGGGQTLYQMHWLLHYTNRSYSDWIISFATLFMLVAIVTGVIIHKKIFKDFFVFRPRKGQRSWLDAHNVLSVITLPFQAMITYSGLIFMGFSFMPLIVAGQYGSDGRSAFYGEVFSPPGMTESAGAPAHFTPLEPLMSEAENIWGQGRIRSIDIRYPGFSNARVVLSESIDNTIAAGAGRLVFDGVSGELLHNAPAASSPAKGVRDTFLGLHEGLFAAPITRWLYFISGLLGTGMVATGLVMWAVKRRQLAERKPGRIPRGILLVEKLNVGTVAGLLTGVAAYFWANRLLPISMAERAQWEVHIMFLTWLALLVHAALRPRDRAWSEQLAIAAIAFAALPVVNALTSDRHLLHSLSSGDWVFAGFDITVLCIGVLLGIAARFTRPKQTASAASKAQAAAQPAAAGNAVGEPS